MPQYDLPLDDLVRYRSSVAPPEDLDAFWAETLAEARGLARTPELQLVDTTADPRGG